MNSHSDFIVGSLFVTALLFIFKKIFFNVFGFTQNQELIYLHKIGKQLKKILINNLQKTIRKGKYHYRTFNK